MATESRQTTHSTKRRSFKQYLKDQPYNPAPRWYERIIGFFVAFFMGAW
jgi:hypothetical protein